MRNLRIAAVICQSLVNDIRYNLNKITYWTRCAQKEKAELVCFPEMNLTGYTNKPNNKTMALSLSGPESKQISVLSESTGLILLVGFAQHNPNGKPFICHCVYWPNGRIDSYRKTHLAPQEKNYYSAGDDVPVFCGNRFTFGIQLCYDAHFPELSTIMTAKGADIIFMPHASPKGDAPKKHKSWMRHLTARAFDNGIFIVACNQTGNNRAGLNFPGNAVILEPSGQVSAKNTKGIESLLIADLKLSHLNNVRDNFMRYFFPNRRPELYKKMNLDKIQNDSDLKQGDP
ncbi:MAG: nitrilase [Desulfobacteraceae bacterium]|nr:nitrilase [Desulfobacteraceae bacterium]